MQEVLILKKNQKFRKIEIVDSWEVNQISIIKVAQDWGMELFRKGRGVYLAYCPNPKHNDSHLGNCVITDNGGKNCFHCFSCGAGGGPIDLVMNLDNCDFITAKNKLAQKYNLVKIEYVDESTLPPKWEGLSAEEYKFFGLQNTTVKIPYDVNEHGETLYKYDRYTLRDLARDDPEFHDQMLIGKFVEKIDAIVNFMALMDCGYFIQFGEGFEFCYDKNWEEACISVVKKCCVLFKKGLMDKNKLSIFFSELPDYLMNEDTDTDNREDFDEEVNKRANEIMAKAREKAKNIILSKRKNAI